MAEALNGSNRSRSKADEKEFAGPVRESGRAVHHPNERVHAEFYLCVPTSVPQGKLVSSTIMESGARQAIPCRALQENVARYEAQFGTLPEGGPTEPNVGFVQ